MPASDFVVIQPALSFGGLKGLLDLPALSGNTNQCSQRGLCSRSMKPVICMLRFLFDTAPDQQAVGPAILLLACNHRPVIKPFALAAFAGRKPLPGKSRKIARDLVHAAPLLIRPAHPLIADNSHYIPKLLFFKPGAQLAVVTINLVAGNPGKGRSCRKCAC